MPNRSIHTLKFQRCICDVAVRLPGSASSRVSRAFSICSATVKKKYRLKPGKEYSEYTKLLASARRARRK